MRLVRSNRRFAIHLFLMICSTGVDRWQAGLIENAHDRAPHALAMAPSSRFVTHSDGSYELFLSVSTDGSVKLWDIRTLECVRVSFGDWPMWLSGHESAWFAGLQRRWLKWVGDLLLLFFSPLFPLPPLGANLSGPCQPRSSLPGAVFAVHAVGERRLGRQLGVHLRRSRRRRNLPRASHRPHRRRRCPRVRPLRLSVTVLCLQLIEVVGESRLSSRDCSATVYPDPLTETSICTPLHTHPSVWPCAATTRCTLSWSPGDTTGASASGRRRLAPEPIQLKRTILVLRCAPTGAMGGGVRGKRGGGASLTALRAGGRRR